MKVLKQLFFGLLLVGLFFSSSVSAGTPNDKYGLKRTMDNSGGTLPQTIAGVNVTDREASTKLVGAVVSIALEVMGVVFFLIIFYSGFNWMTARGNTEKIEKSKDAILDAAIGLIVVMAAYAITNFVFTSLSQAPTGGNACTSCRTEADCTAAGGTSTQDASCSAGQMCCSIAAPAP